MGSTGGQGRLWKQKKQKYRSYYVNILLRSCIYINLFITSPYNNFTYIFLGFILISFHPPKWKRQELSASDCHPFSVI